MTTANASGICSLSDDYRNALRLFPRTNQPPPVPAGFHTHLTFPDRDLILTRPMK